jgi:hypothetical protein
VHDRKKVYLAAAPVVKEDKCSVAGEFEFSGVFIKTSPARSATSDLTMSLIPFAIASDGRGPPQSFRHIMLSIPTASGVDFA